MMDADDLQRVCSERFRRAGGVTFGDVIGGDLPLDELEVIARARVSERLARWRALDDERGDTGRDEPEANEWRSSEDVALWIDGVVAGIAIAEAMRGD